MDRLIDLVIRRRTAPSLVARTRALDRVLLWGHYVDPALAHPGLPRRLLGQVRPARPSSPKYALGFDTWWVDAQKEAALARRKGEIPK